MGRLIDADALMEASKYAFWQDGCAISPIGEYILGKFRQLIRNMPTAEPTLYGYSIKHLEAIAIILQKENLPPDRVAEAITDIDRIVTIVIDEFKEKFEESLLSKLNI